MSGTSKRSAEPHSGWYGCLEVLRLFLIGGLFNMKYKLSFIFIISTMACLLSSCSKNCSNKESDIISQEKESSEIYIEPFGEKSYLHMSSLDLNASISTTNNDNTSENTNRAIASLPEKDIQLCSDSIDGDYYTELIFQHENRILPISGCTLTNSMFPASLELFNEDKNVAIFLLEGEGTGIYVMNLHLINIEGMTEYFYDDPISFLNINLSDRISEDGIIELSFSNKILLFDVSEVESLINLFDRLSYGENITFFIENNTIYCDVALQFSPACFLGYIRLEYFFNGESYIISKMEFEEYSDNTIPYEEK